MKRYFVRRICRMLIAFMAAFAFGAYAGTAGTGQVVAAAQSQGARDKWGDLIGRGEVRNQLRRHGIGPAAAQATLDEIVRKQR